MKSELIPERVIKLMTPQQRREFGVKTLVEKIERFVAKNERQLQSQIVQYLRCRNIEPIWHATHRKSTANKGLPDILFSAMTGAGFCTPVAYEIKFASGLLSQEQSDMLTRLSTRPNCWRVRVIRSFVEVVDDLREMGL